MAGPNRVLVAFVDALGPAQLQAAPTAFASLAHRRSLKGVLGYSSGALPTILTGATPRSHGRMCLFSSHEGQTPSLLAPLRWLGLLPRHLHERALVRRHLAKLLAKLHGLTGYVALHRVPPRAFAGLDLPEREDLFQAETIGGCRTFLADARAAGTRVFSADWRVPEGQRRERTLESLERDPPELAFLYASALDATMHAEGPRGPSVAPCLRSISEHVERARCAMAKGGANLTTLVVGDHGMASVERSIDPRGVLRELGSTKHFVDSTMLRIWGGAAELAQARRTFRQAGWPGRFLDRSALGLREVPVDGNPYGSALFLLREGVIFAPSWVGGMACGMHGYDLDAPSARAALASDVALPPECGALSDVAAVVRAGLGLS